MPRTLRRPSTRIRSRLARRLCIAAAGLGAIAPCRGQNTPLISGGGGFFSSSNQNGTSYLPIAEPLIAAPLGDRVLVESRAALIESATPSGGLQGGYNHNFFGGLTYLQADFLATPHLTVVAGSYLIPFGTYNERLSPVWINPLQDGPLIASLGVMGTGTGLGAQVRGSGVSTPRYNLSYAAYYSTRSGNQQFNAERSFGGQGSLYFKPQRVEAGLSYGRLLQGTHENFYGMHVWYEPENTNLRLRSEFARGHHAQGYWMEADLRTAHFGGLESWEGRLEPVLRLQQTWRRDTAISDGLPLVNTQRVDFGMNYYLPHYLRVMTSYSRQFSSKGDTNIWETGLVYRFLTPAWKEKESAMNARTGIHRAIHPLRVALIVIAGSTILASKPVAQQAEPGSIVPSTPITKVPATQNAHGQSEGERVFADHCSRCHTAPEGFPQRISGTVVRHMRVRASLSEQEEQGLLRFLNPQ